MPEKMLLPGKTLLPEKAVLPEKTLIPEKILLPEKTTLPEKTLMPDPLWKRKREKRFLTSRQERQRGRLQRKQLRKQKTRP
jgi:hypothetical protein